MTLLAIDPGKHGVGWAVFSHGSVLISAGYRQFVWRCELVRWIHVVRPNEMVIEVPQVYTGAKNTKGADPADLIEVAITVGACMAAMPAGAPITKVAPAGWKGQVPKHIMQKRCDSGLKPSERKVIDDSDVTYHLRHNMWDAVGIGLNHLGRI